MKDKIISLAIGVMMTIGIYEAPTHLRNTVALGQQSPKTAVAQVKPPDQTQNKPNSKKQDAPKNGRSAKHDGNRQPSSDKVSSHQPMKPKADGDKHKHHVNHRSLQLELCKAIETNDAEKIKQLTKAGKDVDLDAPCETLLAQVSK